MNVKENRRRDPSLDLLRGIAIVLVVVIHNCGQLEPSGIMDNILMMAAQTAVPCFFMVSGALFLNADLHMKKHLRHLAVFYGTYVLWRAIYYGIYHVLTGAVIVGGLREWIGYLFLMKQVAGVTVDHFWFMEALMVILLIAPVFQFCWKQNRMLVYYAAVILAFFGQGLCLLNQLLEWGTAWTGKENFQIGDLGAFNPLHFKYSVYLLFYLLGAILYENRKKVSAKAACGMILTSLPILIGARYLILGSITWEGGMIPSGYFRVCTAVMAAGMFWLVTGWDVGAKGNKTAQRSKIILWWADMIGRRTQGIFYLHMPMLAIFAQYVAEPYIGRKGWIWCLLESMLIVVAAAGITGIWRKLWMSVNDLKR